MAQFRIAIAGAVAEVTSLFDSTRDYCRRYLTDEPAETALSVSREDLLFEQNWLLEEARQEGLRPRIFTDPFLERAAIQRKIAEYLFRQDVLMLHGSTVAVDGEAFLFTAKCGTGKSTHTRLWRQAFGDRAVMVNDDKPFLRTEHSTVLACGSPWSGKHGLDSNITVPLRGICVLERGGDNRIRAASVEEVLPMLLHQCYRPLEDAQLPRLKQLLRQLAEQTPLWYMQCTREPDAALVSYRAMSGRSE